MITTTISQLKGYVPAFYNANDDDITPHITEATNWIKDNILGSDLYELTESDSGYNDEFLAAVRKSVSLLAAFNAIPELDLAFTPNGFVVTSNPNQAPASKDRVEKLRNKTLQRKDRAIEDLITYIYNDENLLTVWSNSDQFKDIFSILVYSANDLAANSDEKIDRTLYLRLRDAMHVVEKTTVRNSISNDYLEILRSRQRENNFDEADKEIIKILKRAIIHLAIARSIYSQSVIIDHNGVIRPYEIGRSSYANKELMEMAKADKEAIGNELLAVVVNIMVEDIDNYPEFEDSDEYTALTTYDGFENEEDNSIFLSNV